MTNKIILEYINALAGAGKTYNFARLAHRWAQLGNKVMLIQPSKKLNDKTLNDEFLRLNPSYPITVIHSNNTCDVLGSIIKHMKNALESEGEVLLITQQAFLNLPYMENKQNWHLLVDEEPPVHDCDVRNIPDTHRIITDMVEVEPLGTEYGLMTRRPAYEPPPTSVIKKSLRSIAKNKSNDDMLKVIEDIAQKVTSEHWQVYAKLSAFDGLVKYKDKSQLHVHSILHPSIFEGFKRVVIAGALFEEGALFKLWSSLDSVKLVPAGSDIVKGLRYHQHQNGHLLTIKYLIDEPWSKTKRDKIIELDGIEKAAIEYIRDLIGTHLSDKPFVWMGNTDLEDDFFEGLDATRLPNSPHGLNGYTKYDHAVVLSALNPPSSHFKFMVWKGVSEDELRTAIYRSAVYQAIMRISLRDPDSTTQKSVVVMDKATAVWLSNFFAGSKVQLINGKQLDLQSKAPHRPRIHDNNSDKNRVYKTRRAKKKRLLEDTVRLNSNLRVHPDGRELTLAEKFETGTDDKIHGTVFSSVRAYYGADKLMCRSNEEFIAFLKSCHGRTVRSKEENFLISPSVFNPNIPGVESKRGRDNVVFSRCTGARL